jgi:N-acetylglucosamine-6-phosphate deacetylase
MLDPTPEKIRELRAIADDDPLMITLAPERKGALEAIALAASLGVKVSLGHTNAPAEILRQAVQAGATGFTHLGNACPQKLDRHDNILWRALDTPGLAVSLIPDEVHVSPALFRLIHRALNRKAIHYTTDAMAAADAPPGRHTIGELDVEVGADRIVRQPGRNNYAGSALRPLDGVVRAAQMLGCGWCDIWDGFSVRPAEFAGVNHELTVGDPADFCFVQTDNIACILSLRTFVQGS